MSRSKVVSGFEHFTRLNGSVYIHEPTTTTSSSGEPNLILVCGWMDASPRHISKYTAGYEKLYPSARILAITTSSIDAAFTTHGANIKRVVPVLEILYALPPNAKLLLHFFSNGGSFTSTLIARKYKEKMGNPLPTTAVILDSTPGRATYEATVRAFAVTLPKNPVIKFIGILFLRLFYWLYRVTYLLSSQKDLVEKARTDLNTKTLMDVDTPRLYIYSEADDMVAWQSVEEHIEEAKRLGYAADREKYLESGHCGHLMRDEKRYWGAVQRLWSTV